MLMKAAAARAKQEEETGQTLTVCGPLSKRILMISNFTRLYHTVSFKTMGKYGEDLHFWYGLNRSI